MSPLDQESLGYSKSKERVTYFVKSKEVQPGASIVVNISDVERREKAKYPILGETWCYGYWLADGRMWEENAAGVYSKRNKILHPDGKTFKPAAVKLTRLTVKPTKGSQFVVDKA